MFKKSFLIVSMFICFIGNSQIPAVDWIYTFGSKATEAIYASDNDAQGNILSTSHSTEYEAYGSYLAKSMRKSWKIYGLDHTHGRAGGIYKFSGPSGLHVSDPTWGTEYSDIASAKKLEGYIPNIYLRVYDVETKKFIPYNSKGKL